MKRNNALFQLASGMLFLLPVLHIPAISAAYGDELPVVPAEPVVVPVPVITPVPVVSNMAGAILNAGTVNVTEFSQNREEDPAGNERKPDEETVAAPEKNEIAPKNPRN